jgi:hypothetical protein
MVNRLIIRHRLTHEMSLFGGVFYILIMSLFPSYGGLSSILIANLFLLIALSQLFTTHKKLQSASRIFSVGFWLAISSLFYFGYFPLLLFGLVGLSSLRTMRSKDWLQYFFGYAAPFICLGMVSYLTVDSLALPVAHFSDYFGFLDVSFNSDIISWIEIGLFSGLILLSLINYSNFNLKKGIHAQKKIDLHFWLLFFSFFIFICLKGISHYELLILGIPLSLFLAILFLRIKRKSWAEFFHFLLLGLCFGIHIWALL